VKSNWRAWRTVRQFWKPSPPKVVVGLGGFASVPALWMASRRRTPMVLLEQNSIPGRATRWFASQAAAVCLGFPEAGREFPARVKAIPTGNPVRDDIGALTSDVSTLNEKRLLILGGSQGANGLNRAIIAWITARPDDLRGWSVVHQAGPHAVVELTQAYQSAGIAARVEEFLTDMACEYRAASHIIARAGATTLAELACAGRPAILVPFPDAADDHQRRNAHGFEQTGAALCIEQHAPVMNLAATWAEMITPARSTALSAAMNQQAQPQAAAAVAQVVLDVIASSKT
jgi:UDP-N-acetylglucosamine--N-acetylmuramyl-(pentapeptide) pyrophosphoryl-undecaprenol N-acetylglucosamine transferase